MVRPCTKRHSVGANTECLERFAIFYHFLQFFNFSIFPFIMIFWRVWLSLSAVFSEGIHFKGAKRGVQL
jgi:hypothetical protein